MNIHIAYAIFAVILVSPAYGINELPIVVYTDSDTYDHKSVISVTGSVNSIRVGTPVTYKIINPIESIVTVGQENVNSDGTFEFTLNTMGDNWKYDGKYTIHVQYGPSEINNWVIVNLIDGVMPSSEIPVAECSGMDIAISDKCIAYTLTSGKLVKTSHDDKSITLYLDTTDGSGSLELSKLDGVLLGTHTVLVDYQQWDDVEIDSNTVVVTYPAGTEIIEVYGTQVIPEFGAISAIILAIAITSVLAVTAKTRLGIQPKI
ncbi:MAG: PEFG-CTERM sorting domain-containing protein [Cenarchaeum symbiont of Oopsacas minuta]|nr:PEFG-CTERM sorting domain-containing protein [Cenarchaeum symbiont of Oopsacas minuta]